MTERASKALARPAEWFGYVGVAPLLACALAVASAPSLAWQEFAQRLAVSYGAILLAVVGAVHWGLALAERLRWRTGTIAAAGVPSVLGVTAIMLGGQRALALLVVSFGFFWLYERRLGIGGLLPRYAALRRMLTLGVCAALTLTMLLSDSAGLR
jgi:hypothetical protein